MGTQCANSGTVLLEKSIEIIQYSKAKAHTHIEVR